MLRHLLHDRLLYSRIMEVKLKETFKIRSVDGIGLDFIAMKVLVEIDTSTINKRR